MLPDFLKTKEKLKIMIDYELKQAKFLHLGPLANIPEIIFLKATKPLLTVMTDLLKK